MTREQSLTLPAGRELDQAVHRGVMGCTEASIAQHHSTGNAAAWLVAEKFKAAGWLVIIASHKRGWEVEVTRFDGYGGSGVVVAETFPLAMCRAALLVGVVS